MFFWLDVDECREFPDLVCWRFNSSCENQVNSGYTCNCPDGWKAIRNDVTKHGECVGIDECQEGLYNCLESLPLCENAISSSSCECSAYVFLNKYPFVPRKTVAFWKTLNRMSFVKGPEKTILRAMVVLNLD